MVDIELDEVTDSTYAIRVTGTRPCYLPMDGKRKRLQQVSADDFYNRFADRYDRSGVCFTHPVLYHDSEAGPTHVLLEDGLDVEEFEKDLNVLAAEFL